MTYNSLKITPDNVNWKDSGCSLYMSCLQCPRDTCIEDEPGALISERLKNRARQMLEYKQQGKTIKEIAGIFSVCTRTVDRGLAYARKEIEIATDAVHPRNNKKRGAMTVQRVKNDRF